MSWCFYLAAASSFKAFKEGRHCLPLERHVLSTKEVHFNI